MSRRDKKKPAKPSKPMTAAERRARDFQRVQLQPEASSLPANADVLVEQAERPDATSGKKGNIERARRMDAFEALKATLRERNSYDAARRLEKDIVIRRGEHDRGAATVRVDSDRLISPRQYAMVEAGRRVDRVLAMVGDRDAWLLMELIAPTAPVALAATSWRDVVRYVTGEEFSHGQCAAVRSACENLMMAYRKCDESPRAAA